MPIRVSVLVPIYNVETYLRQALESLVAQTMPELEFICINDGSTDGSLKIIQEFMRQDKRIRLLDKPNTGYGDSMNQALRIARGQYIGILEPDDWLEPETFATLYQLAERYTADVVKANYYKESHQHTEQVQEIKADKAELLYGPTAEQFEPSSYRQVFGFAPAIWSAIYRREFLSEQGIDFLPSPGASYQDVGFSFKVWATARRVVLTPATFYHYRTDNASSSVNNPGKVDCVREEYADIARFLRAHELYTQLGGIMQATKFANYHWNLQRLSPQLAASFYRDFRQEFLEAQRQGLLRRANFTPKHWLALESMLRFPHLTYRLLRLRSAWKNSSHQKAAVL